MKTAKEIILERHRSAAAKLEVSAESLAAVARGEMAEPKRVGFGLGALIRGFWLEAVLPWKRVWLGMAAVWLGILVVQAYSRPEAGRAMEASAKPNAEVRMVLLEQQRMLAQLLEPMATARPSPEREGAPRSEGRVEEAVV